MKQKKHKFVVEATFRTATETSRARLQLMDVLETGIGYHEGTLDDYIYKTSVKRYGAVKASEKVKARPKVIPPGVYDCKIESIERKRGKIVLHMKVPKIGNVRSGIRLVGRKKGKK